MVKPALPRSILNHLFGLQAGLVEAMLMQYDADVVQRPIGAGKSLEAALKQQPKLPAHIRRMLIMIDCMPDGAVSVNKGVRVDDRTIYYLSRSHALDLTIAWDGREFVTTTGARIEDWLRGDVAAL